MGRIVQRKFYLLGEEALFLMDRGQLEVLLDGYPLTLQHAMRLMFDTEMTQERYLVRAPSIFFPFLSFPFLSFIHSFILSFFLFFSFFTFPLLLHAGLRAPAELWLYSVPAVHRLFTDALCWGRTERSNSGLGGEGNN